MTPTPLFRPYSICVEKRIHWALRTIGAGLRGDGPLKPELTADGIASTLLASAIETKWPGLLEGFSERSAVDNKYEKRVADSLKTIT